MKTKIDIDNSPFVRSHGRAPSGRGSWAFAIDGASLPLIWTPSMTFADAKVWAKAAMRGMIADGTIAADLPCIDLSLSNRNHTRSPAMNATTLPPSVFARNAHPRMTERYVHVNTHEIVEMMEGEGFVLDSATSRFARTRDPLYTKHQLDFRHPDIPQIDGGTPRVLFTNAHDGSSSAKFMMGVYRFVCSNGLVVGSTYAKEVVRHSGEAARQLIERVRALSRNMGPLFAQIDEWTRRELSRPEEVEFARLASVLRFGDAQRFDPAQLLETRREEDDGATLWRVFNRVQENALSGSLVGYSADGRRLASRPVKGLDKITDFNVQLWRLAEEFAG